MPYRKFSTEFAVGIFVILGVGIMVSFVFFISGFQFIRPGYTVKINFNFANGVNKSAPIRLSGVEVGEVKKVYIKNVKEDEPRVELIAWFGKDVRVPKDSKVFVNNLGLLGEKYIEIVPGKNYRNVLSAGDSIRGVDPLAMFELSGYAKDIALKLSDTVGNINETVVNINDTVGNIKKISQSLSEGKGTVGKLLNESSIYDNLDAFVADLKAHPWKLLWRAN